MAGGNDIPVALEVAASLCHRFEGLRLKPYLCPAGIPTIGYGSTYYEDGTKVTLKDPAITKDRAETLLTFCLTTVYLPGVLTICPRLKGQVLGAIVDFAFNLGVTRLKTSTLAKRLNAEDWDGARKELGKWVNGGGRALPGLVIRRQAESTYLPSSSGTQLSLSI